MVVNKREYFPAVKVLSVESLRLLLNSAAGRATVQGLGAVATAFLLGGSLVVVAAVVVVLVHVHLARGRLVHGR